MVHEYHRRIGFVLVQSCRRLLSTRDNARWKAASVPVVLDCFLEVRDLVLTGDGKAKISA